MKVRYSKEIVPALMKHFKYTNVMAVPKLEKIVVNMGLGEAIANAKIIDVAVDELGRITGQRPVVTQSEEVDRELQAAAEHADRRGGHSSRRTHV